MSWWEKLIVSYGVTVLIVVVLYVVISFIIYVGEKIFA